MLMFLIKLSQTHGNPNAYWPKLLLCSLMTSSYLLYMGCLSGWVKIYSLLGSFPYKHQFDFFSEFLKTHKVHRPWPGWWQRARGNQGEESLHVAWESTHQLLRTSRSQHLSVFKRLSSASGLGALLLEVCAKQEVLIDPKCKSIFFLFSLNVWTENFLSIENGEMIPFKVLAHKVPGDNTPRIQGAHIILSSMWPTWKDG